MSGRREIGGRPFWISVSVWMGNFGSAATSAGTVEEALALRDRLIRNDPGALKAIYDRCCGRALALALKILKARADAEEVIQETFFEVWKRAGEYDPKRGGIEAWVLTIARSRAIDRLRAEGAGARLKNTQENPIPDLVVTPRDAAEQQQERGRVAAALAALPAEQRQVVELAYFEGLSQREIADRTGNPLGTVKTRVRLGMEKLAALLESADSERTS